MGGDRVGRAVIFTSLGDESRKEILPLEAQLHDLE